MGLIENYNATRANNSSLLDALKQHTEALTSQGATAISNVPVDRARQVMENQLTITRNLARQQQLQQPDFVSQFVAQNLPHRAEEQRIEAATKAQAAQNLAGTLVQGTHVALSSGNHAELANQLGAIGDMQSKWGMSLGQALAHVSGDTLQNYQPPTFEEMKAKAERNYGTGGAISNIGIWNPIQNPKVM